MKKQPCVYFIHDTTEKMLYVGSTQCLSLRMNDHRSQLKNQKHSNPRLQEAHNKGNNFRIEHVNLPEGINPIDAEQVIIDAFQGAGILYNYGTDAYAPSRGRKHDEKSILKQRERALERWGDPEERMKQSERMMGRELPESTKKAISEGKIKHAMNLSQEEKKQMTSKAHEGARKKVIADGITYNSIGDAAIAHSISGSTVTHRINSPTFPNWLFA